MILFPGSVHEWEPEEEISGHSSIHCKRHESRGVQLPESLHLGFTCYTTMVCRSGLIGHHRIIKLYFWDSDHQDPFHLEINCFILLGLLEQHKYFSRVNFTSWSKTFRVVVIIQRNRQTLLYLWWFLHPYWMKQLISLSHPLLMILRPTEVSGRHLRDPFRSCPRKVTNCLVSCTLWLQAD